jgi:hypothetical protein
VFLLNSRTPRVIATCIFLCRHHLYRRYMANMPNSLRSIPPIRLSLFNQEHLSRFLVRFCTINTNSFFMDTRPCRNIAAHPSLFYFSTLCLSIELFSLNLAKARLQLAQCVKNLSFVTELMHKVHDYERVSLSLPSCYEVS